MSALHASGKLPREDACAAALAALRPEMARLDALLEREIVRLRARYDLTQDEFRGLYVSDRQVDELVRQRDVDGMPPPSAGPPPAPPADEAAPLGTPWERLRQVLEWPRATLDLVLAALAPEVAAKYETLFAYLNDDVTRKWPTLELAGRLFADAPARRAALRAHLPPLLEAGLAELVPTTHDLPHAQRGFRLSRPFADWLLGLPYHDERLDGTARILDREDACGGLTPSLDDAAERAARWLARDTAPPVVCTAACAADAVLLAEHAIARAGRNAVVIDLEALRAGDPGETVTAVRSLCALFRLALVAGPLDALCDHDGRLLDSAAAALRRLLRGVAPAVLASTPTARWRELLASGPLAPPVELGLGELPLAERRALWQAALGAEADAVDVVALADRFALGPTAIARAARRARETAATSGAAGVTSEQLFATARALAAEGVEGGLVRTIPPTFSWEDIVLAPTARARLNDVRRAVELRPRVLDEWGLARRLGVARGVKVLFAGASGTGKTMAAAVLARSLGLALHRIELAGVVSKYIGETEKNLDRAFEAARRAQAILFVDEADALFGRRSEVKDAHDRYANVEIAYLLQKMEDHDGVVILATNLANNLDDAFSRRMHFVVDFPLPDVARREALWRGMLAADAPVADDVDLAFLARQFPLAGGDIRNVVLDAAYRAAAEGRPIAMRHLLRAAAQQCEKQGKPGMGGELKEYLRLLSEDTDGEAAPVA